MDLFERFAMVLQPSLHGLSQIPEDVEAIGHLNGFWRSLPRTQSKFARTVTANHQNAGVLL
jgi:hypothetical protein